jgi:hypothetical protein
VARNFNKNISVPKKRLITKFNPTTKNKDKPTGVWMQKVKVPAQGDKIPTMIKLPDIGSKVKFRSSKVATNHQTLPA